MEKIKKLQLLFAKLSGQEAAIKLFDFRFKLISADTIGRNLHQVAYLIQKRGFWNTKRNKLLVIKTKNQTWGTKRCTVQKTNVKTIPISNADVFLTCRRSNLHRVSLCSFYFIPLNYHWILGHRVFNSPNVGWRRQGWQIFKNFISSWLNA